MSTDSTILIGDAREQLATLPEASVQCCVTSPPYWSLRDYGVAGQIGLESTPEEYIETLVEVFRAVRRALRPDGTLWLNLGDSYAHSGACGGESPDGPRKPRATDRAAQETMNLRVPPGLKPKDLVGIPWRVALALQADGWWLRSGMPWVKRCLSGGTRLYARTQKGDMPATLKDLVRLDPKTVQLWNGKKWTRVVGWSQTPRPKQPIELTLRTGERIGCTAEHRWPTERGVVRTDELVVGDVLKSCRLAPPGCAVRPRHLPDDLIGWFVGLYIAEGFKKQRAICICGHVKEAQRRADLDDICYAYDGSTVVTDRGGKSQTVELWSPVLMGILDAYVVGEDAHHKHLTSKAWMRTNEFLTAVLDGYLEGDGHWDEKANRWRLGFCNNDALAADLRTISARLGFSCRLRRTHHKFNGKRFPGWKGEIRYAHNLDMAPKGPPGGFTRKSDYEIIKIGKSRARKFWDVEVEDKPNLFALASGTLTHNSPMPESCTDRPTSALEYVFLLTPSSRYFFDMEAVRQKHSGPPVSHYGVAHGGEGDRDGKTWQTLAPNRMREYNPAGRAFRNTDFYYASLKEPHGLICVGDELVGLDVVSEAFKEAHFATFPRRLVEPMIKAGTSERGCCPECGAPWVRVVDKQARTTRPIPKVIRRDLSPGVCGDPGRHVTETRTVGWKPGCECCIHTEVISGFTACSHQDGEPCSPPKPIPCTVLDPFDGAGTTRLVAKQLGRRGIGIELNESYAAMAKKRIANPEPLPEIADVDGQERFSFQEM